VGFTRRKVVRLAGFEPATLGLEDLSTNKGSLISRGFTERFSFLSFAGVGRVGVGSRCSRA